VLDERARRRRSGDSSAGLGQASDFMFFIWFGCSCVWVSWAGLAQILSLFFGLAVSDYFFVRRARASAETRTRAALSHR